MTFHFRIQSFILRKKTIIDKSKILLRILMLISFFGVPQAYCGKGGGGEKEERFAKTTPSIQNIHDELLLHIFSFLDFPELLPVSEVCRSWHTGAIKGATNIPNIKLRSNPSEEKLRAIGQWTMESIEISEGKLGVRECGVFALAGVFSQLKSLNLAENQIGDEGVKVLVASEALQSLTLLDLYGNQISDEGVEALVNSKVLKSLVFLGLGWNQINGESLRNLAFGGLPSLKSLELYRNQINDKGLKALLTSVSLPSLTSLQLAENKISHKGAKALANTNLPSLRSLYLDGNKIGDKGVAALAISDKLPSLTKLDLCRTGITATGLAALAKGKTDLVFLGLGENRIDDAGVKALTDGNSFPVLTGLHLHLNEITHNGLSLLANSHFSNLKYLLISSNNFNPKKRYIQEILKMGILASITKLEIWS